MAGRYAGAGASSASRTGNDEEDAGSFSGSEGSFSGESGGEYESGVEDDFDDGDYGSEGDENAAAPGGGVIVRQNSNFDRLSADSWLTVVSEYEKDGPNENLLFSQVEDEPQQSPEEQAAAQEMHAASAVAGSSVLDAVVCLLHYYCKRRAFPTNLLVLVSIVMSLELLYISD